MLPWPKIVELFAENGTSAKNLPMDQDRPLLRGFAICTAPRSGSNFLSQLLSSTGELGRPLEYFNGPGRRYFDDPDYPDDRGMQIDRILTMGATSNGIYGLKIFAHQYDWIEGQTQWTSMLPNLRFIFLRRRDMLGQAISWARALQTGQYRHGQTSTGEAEFDGEANFGPSSRDRDRVRPMGNVFCQERDITASLRLRGDRGYTAAGGR